MQFNDLAEEMARRWSKASGKYTCSTESQLHSMKQAAKGNSLNANSDKTKLMRFNQDGTISSLNAFELSRLIHIHR